MTIPLEPCYQASCIFCTKPTSFRIACEVGRKHEVCESCAATSRTIECAEEKYAIIDELYPIDDKGNSIPRKGEPGYKKGRGYR